MDPNAEKSTAYNPAYQPNYPPSYNQPYPAAQVYTVDQRYPPAPGFAGTQVIITGGPSVPPPPQPQPQPAPSYNPRYPPQNVPPPTSEFARNQKNNPQSNSVNSVSMIFISGGMNWAWSCYFNSPLAFTITTHMQICWFIGAIIGAILSSVATRRIPTKIIFTCAGILVTIGGILFMAQPDNAAAITAARYLDGIGVGMALVSVLVVAGEEIIKEKRGIVTSLLVAMGFSLGILVDIIYATIYSYYGYRHYSFSGTDVHGLLSIVSGVVTVLMSYFLFVESPVYYLLRDEEDEALDCMRRLQRPFVVSYETYSLLEELKRYVADNKEDGGYGLLALFKLCLYQGLSSLSFSAFMIGGFVTATVYDVGPRAYWPYIVLGGVRWLGAFIAGTNMEAMGRKKLMSIGCFVGGGLAIAVGSIYDELYDSTRYTNISAIMYLIFVLQLFAGFFISAAPVYSTEAYPLALKPYYIAIGFIVEMIVQIIISTCTLTIDGFTSYFIAMGAMYIAFFFFMMFTLPETNGDSLRVAQSSFHSFGHKRIQW